MRSEVNVDDAQVKRVMQRVADAGANAEPLMGRISGVMMDAVEENFAQQGRPKWLGLKPGSVKKGRAPARILQDTGRLAASITPFHDNTQAGVGTNVVYARIHNDGGKTRPHVILPKNKKALAFGGRVVKKVNHPGSKMPARPFLMLAPGDNTRVVQTVSGYLASVMGSA